MSTSRSNQVADCKPVQDTKGKQGRLGLPITLAVEYV